MNKLYVVGFGAGSRDGMTLEAEHAIAASDLIVGYTVYVDLLKPFFPEKAYASTAMRQEKERVRYALDQAGSSRTVALICSGDSGVYGMAGLALEILGAPLTHDFAVISLSDLLTPWEKIEKRLECAAAGDFAVALYNPSSHKRRDYLKKACEILLRHQSPGTVCGYVKNIGREGEQSAILTLGELMQAEVDMFTTVFIGNSETRVINGRMVTPRGYRHGSI